MYKVLVVEDDEDINRILKRYLENHGYQAFSAYSGTEARLLMSMGHYELILLDLMIPGITGEELIKEIRQKDNTPIIVISAKSTLEDKVNTLKSGADDYITKPFAREEVLARVEAMLRRSDRPKINNGNVEVYTFKNLIIDPKSREVTVNGNEITLTAFEFDILLLLVRNKEQVFTKEQLYQEIWQNGYYGEDNTINVHISNIRKKVKEFDDISYIKTVWGIGFKMDTAVM
ncbi:response regulator transcription factor [Anaerocolumna sp. MB42-C2]|uniref:response regulator transcription factor n=1 Tax=Anaerocolumna sp. MB42-C2 TaxID=3070997 RepID=UPI0027E113F1|nr:response regulator transcription factor [Anaerocolumna sp. MB42-C2]WMJ87947.1 response regulator transcription factor [Anaerocolumna sp. MB42-C2]